jgi:hypothetical protein
MAGELILNEVAQPSTPASGKDGIYMANATLPRLTRVDSAGNVWPIQEMLLCALSSNYTLTNGTAVQKAFNATPNGAITLPASSSWLFEANYLITNTGTTSHTWAVLFGGTASLTSGQLVAQAISNTSNAVGAASAGYTTTLGTAFVVTAASTSVTENVSISLTGVVRINAGGTLIPQVQLSVAPGGVQTMLSNSYIVFTPFGTNTAVALGNWS